MGFKVKAKIDFTKVRESFLSQIHDRMIAVFSLSCKEAVNYAKEKKGYTTQTGALSASIGFQLYSAGALVEEYFQSTDPAGTAEGGALGISTGKAVASGSDAKDTAPIVAVLVAGMPYAIHVESKGLDVLAGAILQLPAILQKNMADMFSDTGVSFNITQ